MKKILLLLALFAGTGTLMAQNTKSIEPLDNTLGSKLLQPFKVDTSWRNNLSNTSTNNLLKQEPFDLNKLKLDQNDKLQKSLLIASEGYNMPVAKLNGYSKMPILVLKGNSKMPVAGKAPKPMNNMVSVNP
jgi:hypothetical protein